MSKNTQKEVNAIEGFDKEQATKVLDVTIPSIIGEMTDAFTNQQQYMFSKTVEMLGACEGNKGLIAGAVNQLMGNTIMNNSSYFKRLRPKMNVLLAMSSIDYDIIVEATKTMITISEFEEWTFKTGTKYKMAEAIKETKLLGNRVAALPPTKWLEENPKEAWLHNDHQPSNEWIFDNQDWVLENQLLNEDDVKPIIDEIEAEKAIEKAIEKAAKDKEEQIKAAKEAEKALNQTVAEKVKDRQKLGNQLETLEKKLEKVEDADELAELEAKKDELADKAEALNEQIHMASDAVEKAKQEVSDLTTSEKRSSDTGDAMEAEALKQWKAEQKELLTLVTAVKVHLEKLATKKCLGKDVNAQSIDFAEQLHAAGLKLQATLS